MTYTVFRYTDPRRPYFVVRWKGGPPGAEHGERSTKEKGKRKAEEWAARYIAAMMTEGAAGGVVTWQAFVDAFYDRRLTRIPSAASYKSALRSFERYCAPKRLDLVTTATFEDFRSALLRAGKSRSTASSYAKHVRAALGWAESEGMINRAPAVKTGQTDDMRGRPITSEELERMLAETPKIVGKRNYEPWRRVLLAAWSIGLRRSEFFKCWWDRTDKIHVLGLSAGTPRIIFPADQHKAGRDMMLPLLPEAAELLRETPKNDRTGPIFTPLRRRIEVRTPDGLGSVIAAIGEAAKVVTATDPDSGRKRFATIHDLRRSLGTRLVHTGSLSVPEVARMMRHSKIETTLAHYADLNVATLASKLTSLEGCTLSCTASSSETPSSVAKSL